MGQLLDIITHFGWIAVVLVIFAESGLLVGFFLPGDSLLFTSGFLVQKGILPINIHVFVVVLFIAAALGNSSGYLIGRKFGRKLFEGRSRLFKKKYLEDAEEFYKKYGSKTLVLAMFVPIVRTFAAAAAGIAEMDYRRFLTFNIIGVAAWVGIMTYLGYFVGGALIKAGLNIEVIAILIIAISLLPGFIHALAQPANRARLARLITRKK